MGKLPMEPAPDWKRSVVRSIIWVSFVGALGYSAAYGGLDFLINDVTLVVEPDKETVALSGSAPPTIELKITLKNSTSEAVALKAATSCKIFRWQVFSQSGEMVQTRVSDDKCPQTPVSAGLASGQQLQEKYAITLVPGRYIAGNDYLVNVWYWGYQAEFHFTAEK